MDSKRFVKFKSYPAESISNLDDTLTQYKELSLEVIREERKDMYKWGDLGCTEKSNRVNRLGKSIVRYSIQQECNIEDKEKICDVMEELVGLGSDRAAGILFDIAIKEHLPDAICGKFKEMSFLEMMNYECFKNLIDTDYFGDIPPNQDTPNYEQELKSFRQQLYVSQTLYRYLSVYNSPLLDEIAHYRIFFKKDLRIATLRASQHMRHGEYKDAFKILTLFNIDMTQSLVSHSEREAALLLAELYEYGLDTAPNLEQALSWYNYCYERFSMEAGYKAGRVFEKMGDYEKAMEWYLKVLDRKELSPTSWERNHRKEDEVKSLLPYRLEISYRNLKKRMNPEGHDKISITVNCSGKFSLRLKVLMSATITIAWDSEHGTNRETIKWKVNGWNRLEHQYDTSGKHQIIIYSDEENVITGVDMETYFSVEKMNLEECKGVEYLLCMNQRASINPKGLCSLKYLNIRNTRTHRLNIRGMHQLVALDISENPSLQLVAEKYLPLRYLAMDSWSDSLKKAQLEENIKLNMGQIVSSININDVETLLPTIYYYLKSSKWADIRRIILEEKDNEEFDKEYMSKLYKMYRILSEKTPDPCPYLNGFLESWGEYLYVCRWERKADGQVFQYEDCEEDTYIWNYS